MMGAAETDATLSRKLGVSRVQVSRVRRGVNRPSPQLAAKIETITKIPAWDLIKPEQA